MSDFKPGWFIFSDYEDSIYWMYEDVYDGRLKYRWIGPHSGDRISEPYDLIFDGYTLKDFDRIVSPRA